MTIRLLAARGHYPVNAIVTLDAGTEAGLVAAKLAEFNLTGGTPYVAPTLPNQRFDAQIEVDPAGAVVGLVADGKVIAIGGGYTPPISQYDRALIIPQIRQANAVKGLSRNINDAQYVGAITDAEVYDTEPGALSVVGGTKALAFQWEKMLWDLSAGESLLIQARVKVIGATTGSQVLFGNSDGSAVEGFNVTQYGPTNSGQPGFLSFSFKANGQTAQAIQIQPAIVAGATINQMSLATDTYHNITIHVDGSTRKIDAWVNCQRPANAGTVLRAGSTVPAVKRNFGLGYRPIDDTFVAPTTPASAVPKPARFQAFRMAVLPAGLKFLNPGLLDLEFNINPYRLFNDTDYVGAV